MAILVRIQEHHLTNCVGYLSNNESSFPQSNSCGIFHCSGVENCASKSCFVLQVYGNRPPFYYLHLNRVFIEKQGLKVGDQAVLEPVKNVEICQWMEIVPETYNDWNIIENTSCIIEDIFLEQIRVFQPGMTFVLHLSSGIAANLRVAQLMPKIAYGSAVLANNSTQVLVAPVSNPSSAKQTPAESQSSSTQNENVGFWNPIDSFLRSNSTCQMRFLRVLPKLLSKIDGFQLPDFTLVASSQDDTPYIKAELVRVEDADLSEPQFATLILFPKNGSSLPECWLKLFELLSKEPLDTCCPSDNLRSLGLNCCTRFKCRTLKRKDIRSISHLNYSCSIKTSLEIVRKSLSKFYQNLPIYSPCLLTPNGVLLKLDYGVEPKTCFFVRLTSDDLQNNPIYCGYFWPDSIPQLKEDKRKPTMRSETEIKRSAPENYAQSVPNAFSFSFQQKLCTKMTDLLRTRLKLTMENSIPASHLLITGPSFSGKSTLMQLIAHKLFEDMWVFASHIDCNEFKSKSPDAIANLLDARLKMLKIRSPSLLLLDNLDFLNAQVEDEDRRRFVAKVHLKIGQLILNSGVHVIASSTSKTSLPAELITFDGRQFFSDTLKLPPMNKDDHAQVFAELLNTSIANESKLMRKIERFNVGETIKLCERLRLTHSKADSIHSDNIIEAVNSLPSISQTQKAVDNETGTSFKDVGGYETVKQQLREIFLWPMMYPQIYKSVGIQIGNGAILHGPSGCGKTLIARSLATETGFSVIHIKGPELLSKYIGASEENVRKVFERARQSKPSLVIFDEFDSLVPKRGHDNTGVTDRVVNQFLTELDGVSSSMEGVYVLAATNRIDLIDTALLRPGRFNHKIYVSQPSREDRLEILRLQCQDVCLEDEDDLRVLADATTSWSGAELRGLIVNALFESVRNLSADKQLIVSKSYKHQQQENHRSTSLFGIKKFSFVFS